MDQNPEHVNCRCTIGYREVAPRAFGRVLECREGGPFDGERRELVAGENTIDHRDGRYVARANSSGEFLAWQLDE